MEKGYKRRNIFIKKDFQGKLILSTFLFVTGGCLLFIVMLSFFSANTLTISYSNNDLQLGQTPLVLLKQILTANWILIAVGGLVLVISSMFLSHRIAGPLFRFERALDNMNSGNLNDTINLRNKDEGKELAEKMNRFNSQLSQSVRAIDNNSKALEALLEQTASLDLPDGEKETIAGLCWSMQEHNKKIRNICNSYTLSDE